MAEKQNFSSKTIAFLGAGNIARAIVMGFTGSGAISPENIIIFNRNKEKLLLFKNQSVRTAVNLAEFKEKDFIFLTVKPNQLFSALTSLSNALGDSLNPQKTTLVSVCAGVGTKLISDFFGGFPVIRAMPSALMATGDGTVALTKNELVTSDSFEYIFNLFDSCSLTAVLDESKMNDIIAVSGSSPAYVYLFIKAMLKGAEQLGFEKSTALPLILKTIEGGARMVRESPKELENLIEEVASPGGTTLAALDEMKRRGFEETVIKAMKKCADRADEISLETSALLRGEQGADK